MKRREFLQASGVMLTTAVLPGAAEPLAEGLRGRMRLGGQLDEAAFRGGLPAGRVTSLSGWEPTPGGELVEFEPELVLRVVKYRDAPPHLREWWLSEDAQLMRVLDELER